MTRLLIMESELLCCGLSDRAIRAVVEEELDDAERAIRVWRAAKRRLVRRRMRMTATVCTRKP